MQKDRLIGDQTACYLGGGVGVRRKKHGGKASFLYLAVITGWRGGIFEMTQAVWSHGNSMTLSGEVDLWGGVRKEQVNRNPAHVVRRFLRSAEFRSPFT